MSEVLVTDLTSKDLGSDLNSLQFIINNRIRNYVNTIIIVKVTAVKEGKLDVQTVLKDLAKDGTAIDTYTIPDVRYLTWQYGQNAITCAPKVGDIGLLLVSKQDTSGLVKDGESLCQTRGVFNLGDGIYLGGLEGLNQDPTQFIHFEDDKIDITGTGTININAPTVNVKSSTANIEAAGTATVKGVTVNVEASGTTTVKGDTVNVEATTAVNLGGEEGAKGIARIGDTVAGGKITGGSTKVKAI